MKLLKRKVRKKMSCILKSMKEVEEYTLPQKRDYYTSLKNICNHFKGASISCNGIIELAAPALRKFKIDIRDVENIPSGNALFVANHSNSHDYFVTKEVFSKIKRKITPLGARDGLNTLAYFVFKMGDVTFIDRDDKKSTEKGILNFCSKILAGKDGIIFGEGTWNLHPIRPMLKVKTGAVQISLITEKPIVPVIYEYVEIPTKCNKEGELYTKCIVQFGKPIYTAIGESIYEQTEKVMQSMIAMRKNLWEELGINRNSISEINKDVYLNHLYLKKFKAIGFKYNSRWESQFLVDKENEYFVNENGEFVPRILNS